MFVQFFKFCVKVKYMSMIIVMINGSSQVQSRCKS